MRLSPSHVTSDGRPRSVLTNMLGTWRKGPVALAVALSAFALPAPSQAAATDPVITSPAPGTVMPNRWDGAVTVDLRTAPDGEYWYDFECDGAGYDAADASVYYQAEFDDPFWTVSPGYPITGPVTCEATVTGPETGAFASARWTVLGPSVTFDSVDLEQAQFFPIVRDGYADTVAIGWAMTADATVNVQVSDSLGRAVKVGALGRLPAGGGYARHSWTWDGLGQDGSLVPAGDYTVTLTATGDDGIARSASRTVTAATGVRESGWKTTRRSGAQASSITRNRGCAAVYQRTGKAVTLDCTRGRRMVGTWRFTLPADAVSIKYEVRGRYWGPHPHVVARRPSATRYDVKIKMLRGMVTRIDKVVVRYKTRTPI